VRELVIGAAIPDFFHALKTMQEQDISQIPVFEENLPIGTITKTRYSPSPAGQDLRKLVVREVMASFAAGAQTAPVERRHPHPQPREPRGLCSIWEIPISDPH